MSQTAAPFRWGILSTARIGTGKVIPGLQRSSLGVVAAIASRDGERARQAAAELGIPKAYSSYEELLADPEIDGVYNPLPNNLHVDWTIRAAEAGKAVLCEKPIGLDAADAARLRGLPADPMVMEAFMVRFHPQWLRAREIVRQGTIGPAQVLQMFFSYNNVDPANIRNKPETGGGALLDIGCYPLTAARFMFEAEPKRAIALMDRDPVFGVDRLTTGILDFGDGRRADFTVGTQIAPYQRFNIFGPKGKLEIEVPANAPQAERTYISVDVEGLLNDRSAVVETIPPSDQYAEQGDWFVRMARGEVPREYGIEHSIKGMQILDALVRSETSGRWEDIG